MRRCVGCMQSKPQSQLIRLALVNNELVVDETGNVPGRGAYICKDKACLQQAIKKNGFGRSYRKAINRSQVENILMELFGDE